MASINNLLTTAGMAQQPQTIAALGQFEPRRFDMAPAANMGTDRLYAASRGLPQGVSMGGIDEMRALEAAAGGGLPGPNGQMRPSPLPNPVDMGAGAIRLGMEAAAPSIVGTEAGQRYDRTIGSERLKDAIAASDSPWTYYGSAMGGGAAVPMGTARTAGQGLRQGAIIGGHRRFSERAGQPL